jgi:hypothetical protein
MGPRVWFALLSNGVEMAVLKIAFSNFAHAERSSYSPRIARRALLKEDIIQTP